MTAIEQAAPVWTLGERMWKARKDAGLEQSDVAKVLGVSRALVSRWERDASDPGTRKLQAFAELTGVPAAWLVSAIGYKSEDAGEPPDLRLLAGSGRGPGRGLPLFASAAPYPT